MMKPIIEQLNKVSMVIRRLMILALMQMIFTVISTAQSTLPSGYCENNEGTRIDLPDRFVADSLYVLYKEEVSGLSFKIINTTDQTVYLFSSYFSEPYYSSKYVHRVNVEDQIYKISFLPLLPYLSTRQTDKLILGSDRMVNKGQILYDFIKLTPQTYYEISLSYDNLFKNFRGKNSLVRDFDSNDKFSDIKFKYLSVNQLKGRFRVIFEFGIYKSVDLLCKQEAYYMQEHKFNTQAKSFKVLKVPVEINNYEHPLF